MLLLLTTLACESEPLPAADCVPSADYTWGTFGASFFVGRCSSCHAASAENRHGAPDTITFDDEAEVWALRESVLDSVVTRGSMPPAGGLTTTEITRLQTWLACRP